MQFGSGILSAKAPVDGGAGSVAPGFVGIDGSSRSHVVAVAFYRRPRRQSRVRTLNSISVMLSQLACLGVW